MQAVAHGTQLHRQFESDHVRLKPKRPPTEAAYGTTATLHEVQWKSGPCGVATTPKPSGRL
jgi:hypothetical protein